MNLQQLLQERLRSALTGLVDDPAPYVSMLKPAQDAKHGDYQANCAMPLAKKLGKPPREIAQQIAERLPLDDLLEKPEIAGPGFINLRLKSEWLARQLQRIAVGDRLGIDPATPAKTLVIDYSSPNVAKPMHVGHLRSTIIGDALARLFRFLGHTVIADNHLGDWGTQFGILLYGYKHFRNDEALKADPVREMARIYIRVRNLMKTGDDDEGDGPVAEAARQETAKLHAGDPENVRLWQQFMPWCLEEIERIYRRLDVHFDHTHGESFYNPQLPTVVQSLVEKGLAQKSEGAMVIFTNPDDPPALVQKRDGAFTYTTTDLATIRHRVEQWNPAEILYVVDFRQASHFKPLFEIARRWGYDKVRLEHVSFGAMLGPDRKPLQTRKGGNVELSSLLDEAEERAGAQYQKLVEQRLAEGKPSPDLTADEKKEIAIVIGLGAVKYADLCQNRTTDYVFNLEKMVQFEGNTAAYLQYAYARTRNIFAKGEVDVRLFRQQPPQPYLETPEERGLALRLLGFEEALVEAMKDYRPNAITAYLAELARAFSTFYNDCHVLEAETPLLRQSRLLLCDLTARTIQKGLELLGIRTVERM